MSIELLLRTWVRLTGESSSQDRRQKIKKIATQCQFCAEEESPLLATIPTLCKKKQWFFYMHASIDTWHQQSVFDTPVVIRLPLHLTSWMTQMGCALLHLAQDQSSMPSTAPKITATYSPSHHVKVHSVGGIHALLKANISWHI